MLPGPDSSSPRHTQPHLTIGSDQRGTHMAARKTRFDPQYIREKIRATQLAKRLDEFVFGRVEMTPHQVTAALGLLKKSVPDLAATELKGDLNMTVIGKLVWSKPPSA